MLIISISMGILCFCIMAGVLLTNKLPKKVDVQLEIPLLIDTDCSLEKVVMDLQIANELGDIESAVQLSNYNV